MFDNGLGLGSLIPRWELDSEFGRLFLPSSGHGPESIGLPSLVRRASGLFRVQSVTCIEVSIDILRSDGVDVSIHDHTRRVTLRRCSSLQTDTVEIQAPGGPRFVVYKSALMRAIEACTVDFIRSAAPE